VSDFNCRAIGSQNEAGASGVPKANGVTDADIPSLTVGDLFKLHCQKEAGSSGELVLDPQAYLKVETESAPEKNT
jgi:hypothetical protein